MLRTHCAAVGRDYDAIERTTLGGLSLTRDGRDGSRQQAGRERFSALGRDRCGSRDREHAAIPGRGELELIPELTARLADIGPGWSMIGTATQQAQAQIRPRGEDGIPGQPRLWVSGAGCDQPTVPA